jgi:hypothetical protein
MATTPTTWVTVNADGHLEVFMIGVNDAGDQGFGISGKSPMATAGPRGSLTAFRRDLPDCVGPRRLFVLQMVASSSLLSATIFNPVG